jgi:hypothetical protein
VTPRIRLLLLLAVVPLTAFQCVPSTLVRVSVDDPPARALAKVTGAPEAYERAVALAKSFAGYYSLAPYSDRCVFGHLASGEGGMCSGFSRFSEDGILLEVLYSPENQTTMIFVVKEARVFGKYTKADVHEEFHRQIVSPLTAQLGRERVSVH